MYRRSGLYPAIDYLKDGTNRAMNTKGSIIFIGEADATINKKIKEIEEKAWKKIMDKRPEEIHFDPSEIEPIVLKNNDKEER